MIETTVEPLNLLTNFSFSTIFEERAINVSVSWNEIHYEVFIDGIPAAQIDLDENEQAWLVITGQLDDSDLLKEIGMRIEARYL